MDLGGLRPPPDRRNAMLDPRPPALNPQPFSGGVTPWPQISSNARASVAGAPLPSGPAHGYPQESGRRLGYGAAPCHHGELFQGADQDPITGKQRVILTTMRTPWIGSRATFAPDDSGVLRVEPVGKKKSLRTAALTLEALGLAGQGGSLTVKSFTIEGRGFGASTSDCLAAVRAVCDAFHTLLGPQATARLIYEAEGALDPLMFDRDVIFRSREGVMAEDLGGNLPPVDFLGFDVDPGGPGVVTEACVHPAYTLHELECFRPIIGALRHCVAAQDPVLLGRVASASTRINQGYLPKPELEGIFAVAGEAGSLGVSVAHTGTLVTLLFDPRDPRSAAGMDRAQAGLEAFGFGPFWRACHIA